MGFSQKKFESLPITTKASHLSMLLRHYLETSPHSSKWLKEYSLYLKWTPTLYHPAPNLPYEDQYHHWQKIRGHFQGLLSLPQKKAEKPLNQIVYPPLPWCVLLDNFRSGYNTGSVFRTADATGFQKVYLGGLTPDKTHKSVQSAGMGAESWVPYHTHFNSAIWLKTQKIPIIGLELTKESIPLQKWTPPPSGILILGNEERGISQEIAELCDSFIYIPMSGRKYSMNVASAFAIAAYYIRENLPVKSSMV